MSYHEIKQACQECYEIGRKIQLVITGARLVLEAPDGFNKEIPRPTPQFSDLIALAGNLAQKQETLKERVQSLLLKAVETASQEQARVLRTAYQSCLVCEPPNIPRLTNLPDPQKEISLSM